MGLFFEVSISLPTNLTNLTLDIKWVPLNDPLQDGPQKKKTLEFTRVYAPQKQNMEPQNDGLSQ